MDQPTHQPQYPPASTIPRLISGRKVPLFNPQITHDLKHKFIGFLEARSVVLPTDSARLRYWRGAATEDFAVSVPFVKRKVTDFTWPDRTIMFFSQVENKPCEEARKS
jgi:hypothetical protein